MFKSLAIQIFVFLLIFQGISMLRETSMLGYSESVPEHNLPTLTGDVVSVGAFDKPVVVYFFAPWCKVCHMSIKNLQKTYEEHGDIDVIAVALDFADKHEVEEFVGSHQLTFPVALGNETIKSDYQISGYPSYYVINEQNIITSKSLGYSTELGLQLRVL